MRTSFFDIINAPKRWCASWKATAKRERAKAAHWQERHRIAQGALTELRKKYDRSMVLVGTRRSEAGTYANLLDRCAPHLPAQLFNEVLDEMHDRGAF